MSIKDSGDPCYSFLRGQVVDELNNKFNPSRSDDAENSVVEDKSEGADSVDSVDSVDENPVLGEKPSQPLLFAHTNDLAQKLFEKRLKVDEKLYPRLDTKELPLGKKVKTKVTNWTLKQVGSVPWLVGNKLLGAKEALSEFFDEGKKCFVTEEKRELSGIKEIREFFHAEENGKIFNIEEKKAFFDKDNKCFVIEERGNFFDKEKNVLGREARRCFFDKEKGCFFVERKRSFFDEEKEDSVVEKEEFFNKEKGISFVEEREWACGEVNQYSVIKRKKSYREQENWKSLGIHLLKPLSEVKKGCKSLGKKVGRYVLETRPFLVGGALKEAFCAYRSGEKGRARASLRRAGKESSLLIANYGKQVLTWPVSLIKVTSYTGFFVGAGLLAVATLTGGVAKVIFGAGMVIAHGGCSAHALYRLHRVSVEKKLAKEWLKEDEDTVKTGLQGDADLHDAVCRAIVLHSISGFLEQRIANHDVVRLKEMYGEELGGDLCSLFQDELSHTATKDDLSPENMENRCADIEESQFDLEKECPFLFKALKEHLKKEKNYGSVAHYALNETFLPHQLSDEEFKKLLTAEEWNEREAAVAFKHHLRLERDELLKAGVEDLGCALGGLCVFLAGVVDMVAIGVSGGGAAIAVPALTTTILGVLLPLIGPTFGLIYDGIQAEIECGRRRSPTPMNTELGTQIQVRRVALVGKSAEEEIRVCKKKIRASSPKGEKKPKVPDDVSSRYARSRHVYKKVYRNKGKKLKVKPSSKLNESAEKEIRVSAQIPDRQRYAGVLEQEHQLLKRAEQSYWKTVQSNLQETHQSLAEEILKWREKSEEEKNALYEQLQSLTILGLGDYTVEGLNNLSSKKREKLAKEINKLAGSLSMIRPSTELSS